MTRPTAAVVICAYTLDRWDDLREAVRSAADQSTPPSEIFVVVDHNPQLVERAQAEFASHAQLRVLENERKKGLSGARNTALGHVRSEIVVFLDDDAAAEPGWLDRLVEPYADAYVMAVGGAAMPRWPDQAVRPETLPAAPSERGELDWVVGCSYRGQPTSIAPVRNLMGCNMSFRREVFAEVGGFSEDLGRVGKTPLGCEETELCIRARAARPEARILFEPAALVRHHVSMDRLTWSYLRHRCYAEGLSKAVVSRMVGSTKGLETEREYATRVLPRGVLRQLGRVIVRGERRAALAGATAIVVGLAATVLGYARARVDLSAGWTESVPTLQLIRESL